MGRIQHLVYISEAAGDLSYTDIREILESSRRNNLASDITGLLIYRDGFFLQLLEGNADRVHKVLNRIRMDERHFKLKILIETTSSERLFGTWSMAFQDGDIESHASAVMEDLFALKSGSDKEAILPLLEKIRKLTPELK